MIIDLTFPDNSIASLTSSNSNNSENTGNTCSTACYSYDLFQKTSQLGPFLLLDVRSKTERGCVNNSQCCVSMVDFEKTKMDAQTSISLVSQRKASSSRFITNSNLCIVLYDGRLKWKRKSNDWWMILYQHLVINIGTICWHSTVKWYLILFPCGYQQYGRHNINSCYQLLPQKRSQQQKLSTQATTQLHVVWAVVNKEGDNLSMSILYNDKWQTIQPSNGTANLHSLHQLYDNWFHHYFIIYYDSWYDTVDFIFWESHWNSYLLYSNGMETQIMSITLKNRTTIPIDTSRIFFKILNGKTAFINNLMFDRRRKNNDLELL